VKALPALGDPTATEPAPSQQRPARSGHQSPQRRTDGYRLDAPQRRGPRGNADPGRTQKNDNIERVKSPKALIEDLDFVNRLERFGQAADRAPPLRNQKFADSPLEVTGFEPSVPAIGTMVFARTLRPDISHPRGRPGTEGLQTHCWREMDSNLQYRAVKRKVCSERKRFQPVRVENVRPRKSLFSGSEGRDQRSEP
jgi:hypothetical protein